MAGLEPWPSKSATSAHSQRSLGPTAPPTAALVDRKRLLYSFLLTYSAVNVTGEVPTFGG
jgi:hypothetical protein